MAAIITDRTVALAKLGAMLQYDQAPALTAGELSDLLDEFKTVELIARSTAYGPNVRGVPNPPNGHVYRVGQNYDGTAGGITGTTPPTYWPLNNPWPGGGGAAYMWFGYPGLSSHYVLDGTATWYEDGPQPASLWDLRAAAFEGWTRKAGKIANESGVRAGKMSRSGSSLRDGCLAMAMRYAPVTCG